MGVSLVALPFAIYQIWRSRDAVKAAEQAVEKTKATMTQTLTAVDLERASSRILRIRELHRRREWKVAIYQYHDLRQMLSDVRARYPDLSPDQRDTIQKAIAHLQTLDRRVAAVEDGQAKGDPKVSNRDEKYLLEVQTTLDDLASELKQQVQVGED
jgi:hypothetical protein